MASLNPIQETSENPIAKYGIIGFVVFIALLLIFSGYVFFNNSSNLEVSIRSNDEQIKRKDALVESLTKNIVDKNDSIVKLDKKIKMTQRTATKKDSVINKQSDEIKKLKHIQDSLTKLSHKYKWSDIESVGKPRQ